jgi:hypothetical protein
MNNVDEITGCTIFFHYSTTLRRFIRVVKILTFRSSRWSQLDISVLTYIIIHTLQGCFAVLCTQILNQTKKISLYTIHLP